jgi:hypothetical protein
MKAGVSVLGAHIFKIVIGCPYSVTVIRIHLPSRSDMCHVLSKSNPEADQDKESRKKVSIYLQVNVNG